MAHGSGHGRLGSWPGESALLALAFTLAASIAPVTLEDDIVPLDDGGPSAALATAGDGEPRVVYLHYAGGADPPALGPPCAGMTPTPFACGFGASLPECQMDIQKHLDRWYADFNLVFTLARPTHGKYYASVITSDGQWCGQAAGTGGVAPFRPSDMMGGTSFALQCAGTARRCAIIIAQEHAHMVGLYHTDSPGDLLNPTVCTTCDGFEDRDDAVVGGPGTQNSYRTMLERLGAWPGGAKPGPFAPPCDDASAPVVVITEPADGSSVGSSFIVRAVATDDCGVRTARLDLDPAGVGADAIGTPLEWPVTDVSGDQAITVTVTDASGKTAAATVTVRADGDGGGCATGNPTPTGGALALVVLFLVLALGRRRTH